MQVVKNFNELATHIIPAELATQTKIDKRRIKRLLGNGVGDMTLAELYKISMAIGMHYELLTDLAIEKLESTVEQRTKQG